MLLAQTMQWGLPGWAQAVVGTSVLIVAMGVIWTKLVKPVAELISLMGELLPLLKDLASHFTGSPDAFQILKEIVAEFRSDSGSTLRDVVNRLEDAANENKLAAGVLKQNLEVSKRLSQEDRVVLEGLIAKVGQLQQSNHNPQ
jgi:hypothetical protein